MTVRSRKRALVTRGSPACRCSAISVLINGASYVRTVLASYHPGYRWVILRASGNGSAVRILSGSVLWLQCYNWRSLRYRPLPLEWNAGAHERHN
jgi:hypothetical protein